MKCIIVDDEPIARRGLKRLVEKYENLELLASFGTAKEALLFLGEAQVDLIFLDIKMDGINGLELAKLIKGQTLVIFTTAFAQYAVESYEVNAIDYLMKPINRQRLEQAIKKAESYYNLLQNGMSETSDVRIGKECIIVKSERKYVRLQISDIIYIEGLKDYVIIHLADSRLVTRLTLKAILELLPDEYFLRLSKSFAVNRTKVSSFDNNELLADKFTLPIGPAYREKVLETLLS